VKANETKTETRWRNRWTC